MLMFFAFIGIVCFLWLVSRMLISIGCIFDNLSRRIEERSLSAEKIRIQQLRTTKKIQKDVRKIRKEQEYQSYIDKVNREINELTK